MIKKEGIENSKICFLSNFPPRECGIATFTKDLVTALNKKWNPKLKSRVIALNENEAFYNYNNKVIMQVNRDDIEDYITTAKKINNSKEIKLVCIQHEFGLFGGEYGGYLIPFLETVEKPVVVTFHSVLPNPNQLMKKTVQFICDKSSAIIVMANTAIDILEKSYGVNKNKIHVIYHGIPNALVNSKNFLRKKLRLENKIVLSTFGLLSKGKGIEYMIKALPKLVEKYPNILYLIIGETHPAVRKNEGEEYRNKLVKIVKKLKLQNYVKFYNKYLTLEEIVSYLIASDIYICTNLDENQIVSGTLSYAIGCGKATVSTPNIYAKEVLSDKKGILAKFRNPSSFAIAINKILSDPKLKEDLEKNAYSFGRAMIWPNVATRYLNIFNKVVKLREEITEKYPLIKLTHLRNLTDDFGCIQFSELSIPDKNSGYTVDDNSRALIASSIHHAIFDSEESLELTKIYLNFLKHAQQKNGNFKNNFKNKEEILNPCSEDAFGRTLWSLGYVIQKEKNLEIIEKAKNLFNKSQKFIKKINSPRAKAFSIMGLCYYFKKTNNEGLIPSIKELTNSLINTYKEESNEDWQWFEKNLTYANSKLPEALFLAYDVTQEKNYLEIAEKTLNFLSNIVFIKDELVPIGQNGWYNRNGKRAFFDQQPIDASSLVQTYLIAYSITKNKEYYHKAVLAFNWFLGKNHLKQMVYNETTGGCYDGLSQTSVNLNQGAESTISYLMARLALEEIKKEAK